MTSAGSIENINEAEGLEIVPYPITDEKPQQPYVGMVFSSIQDAEVVYQDYGRDNGFVIRKRSTYKAQRGRKVTRVLFTCSCEGVHKKKCSSNDASKTRKTRSTMRTNCKAMMRIIRDRETDEWVVNDFTDDHNHVMVTPAKRVLMGSDKHMPHSIMTRWIKEANRGEVTATDDLLMQDCYVGSEAMRISELCRRSTQLAYLAGRSEETYKVAMAFLDQAFEKVKELDSIVVVRENIDKPLNETCTTENDKVLVDPQNPQKKGKKRVRRAKDKAVAIASGTSESGAEISDATKKPRLCKTCNGHGHDTRNCKEKAKDKEIDSNDAGICIDQEKNDADLPTNGVEAIQTTTDLPTNGVDAIQTTADLPTNEVEAIQTTADLGTNGVEAIQTTTDLGTNGVDAIQTTADLGTNGVDAIQTTTDLPTNGVDAIQTTTDLSTNGVEEIQTTTDLGTNGVEPIQTTTDLRTNGVEAIQTTTEIPTNGVEEIQTIEG